MGEQMGDDTDKIYGAHRHVIETLFQFTFNDLVKKTNQDELRQEIDKLKKVINPNDPSLDDVEMEGDDYSDVKLALEKPSTLSLQGVTDEITNGQIRKCIIKVVDDMIFKDGEDNGRDRNNLGWKKEKLIKSLKNNFKDNDQVCNFADNKFRELAAVASKVKNPALTNLIKGCIAGGEAKRREVGPTIVAFTKRRST